MIPRDEYVEIIKKIPILCVDLAIMNKYNKFLVVKRLNEPLAGEWWPPGGALWRGETIKQAAKRILKGEVGITKYEDPYFYGIYQEVFDKGACGPIHTVSVMLKTFVDNPKIELDSQSSDWKWVDKLPDKFKPNA